MIAGALEIQMFAGIVRLQKDMAQATKVVGGAMKNIESSVSQAKTVLASLGVGLGVGYFVSLIKGSIDAADNLRDLSKTTSIAVEQLAGLRLAAQQSGSNLEGTAKSISFLSKNIGANAEEYRKLGITAKDPLEAFKQLSDLFINLEDPQQRSAVMAKALGKAWEGSAPMLSEGSRKIQEMVDKGAKLSGITKQLTEDADEFNDKLAELGGTGGFLTRMIGPLLPLLNVLADDMLKAQEKTHALSNEMSPLAEGMRVLIVLGGNFAFVFRQIGISIAGAGAQIMAFKDGGLKGFLSMRATVTKILNDERAAFDEWEKKIVEAGKGPRAPGASAPASGSADAKAAAARAAAFIAGPEAERAAKAAREKALREYIQTSDQIDRMEEDHAKEIAEAWSFVPSMLEKVKGRDYWENMFPPEITMNKTNAQLQEYHKNLLQGIDSMEEMEIVAGQIAAGFDGMGNKVNEKLTEMGEFAKEAARGIQRGFSDGLFDIMEGKFDNMGDRFAQLLKRMIADVMAAKMATAMFGDMDKTGTAGGFFGTILRGFGIGGGGGESPDARMASGGSFGAGDRLMVGERGPEMVTFNRSGTVTPNNELGGATYYIDARGADSEGMARLRQQIAALNGSIEERAVSAVRGARAHGRSV